MERINNAGLKRLGAIHRGFSSYDKKLYRNLPQWHIPIELRRRIPNLPIICDPSHIGGKRELVAPLCQQAMDLGFNGLIVESHCNPDWRMERCRPTGYAGCIGLHSQPARYPQGDTKHRKPQRIA